METEHTDSLLAELIIRLQERGKISLEECHKVLSNLKKSLEFYSGFDKYQVL